MFALFWSLSAALNGYMRFYMPTNRVVDYLRSPRGLRWAIPVALVATPAYLFAMSVCATITERGGPGYLNVLVMIFAWNAIKFAVMGVLSLPMMVCKGIVSARASSVPSDRRHARRRLLGSRRGPAGESVVTNRVSLAAGQRADSLTESPLAVPLQQRSASMARWREARPDRLGSAPVDREAPRLAGQRRA